jgi:hypothetical protein
LTPRLAKLDGKTFHFCQFSLLFVNFVILSEKDIENRTNFIHLKKFSALLIRAQQVPTLLETIHSPTTSASEKIFGSIVLQRLKKSDGTKKRVRTHSISIVDVLPPTMSGVKKRCIILLDHLEAAGLVTKASGYQVTLRFFFFSTIFNNKKNAL